MRVPATITRVITAVRSVHAIDTYLACVYPWVFLTLFKRRMTYTGGRQVNERAFGKRRPGKSHPNTRLPHAATAVTLQHHWHSTYTRFSTLGSSTATHIVGAGWKMYYGRISTKSSISQLLLLLFYFIFLKYKRLNINCKYNTLSSW